MRLFLPILFVICVNTSITQACCFGWGCCASAKRPVAPAVYKPSEEEGIEDAAIKVRLDALKGASITDIDKAACTALGIQYDNFRALPEKTRRLSLTRIAGEDTSLDFFQDLGGTSRKRALTPGEIGNCIRHLGITEEELAILRGKAAKES